MGSDATRIRMHAYMDVCVCVCVCVCVTSDLHSGVLIYFVLPWLNKMIILVISFSFF